MTARITTHAGRKIRHVAPGHVVDVATGVAWVRLGNGNARARGVRAFDWHPLSGDLAYVSAKDLDGALAITATAESLCRAWAVWS